MKLVFNVFISICCCAAAIALVYFFAAKRTAAPQTANVAKIEAAKALPDKITAPDVSTNEAANDEPEDAEVEYKYEMLLAGSFHGDEVTARSGETWLALFREKDKFYLAQTKIQVRTVRDEIVDGETGEKTGKKVSVPGNKEAVFLLDRKARLRAGAVKTVFYATGANDDVSSRQGYLKNGYREDFQLAGKTYTLAVVTDAATGEHLTPDSRLILTAGDAKQIINPAGGCNDCSWQLIWAGDLDGDGKLDLYADLPNHYNASMPTLFLSSEAENGELIRAVAGFGSVGC